MGKMVVECITENKRGPKPKYASLEEKYKAQLEANRRYRLSAKGKEQKKKDDSKYFSSDKGKEVRRANQARHRKTEKGKATYRRYWQSEKGRELLRLYWQSEKGKSLSRAMATKRRHLIRAQKIKDHHYDEIRLWYMNCPEGYEVDHIVPITNDVVCGLHVPWNFQYLTINENRSKMNYFETPGANNDCPTF